VCTRTPTPPRSFSAEASPQPVRQSPACSADRAVHFLVQDSAEFLLRFLLAHSLWVAALHSNISAMPPPHHPIWHHLQTLQALLLPSVLIKILNWTGPGTDLYSIPLVTGIQVQHEAPESKQMTAELIMTVV